MSLETESEIAAVIATTKFCRDCKWCVPSAPGTSVLSWQCRSPEIPQSPNVVDGSSKPLVSFCDIARERPVYCGPDARWFIQADIRQAVTG